MEFKVRPNGGGNWIFTALGWFIPPFLFFLIIGWFATRFQAGGDASNPLDVGKSKARFYLGNANGIKITFADVAGVDEASSELQEVVDFLKNPDSIYSIRGKNS